MKNRILVADDEQLIRTLVRDFLENAGYEVIEAADGQEAVELFNSTPGIQVIILDLMMPVLDGAGALKAIREKSGVPVILLTARSEEQDEIDGLLMGADEYVTKPFSPRTLVARVDALVRRSTQYSGEVPAAVSDNTDNAAVISGTAGRDAVNGDILSAGGIMLDKAAHTVTADGEPVELSFKEFELLAYFMENQGIALSRERILNHVWDYDYYGDSRTIDTHVKKLRAKLKGRGEAIQTIWGLGYKFMP